jgi:hypothetical protein
MVSNYGHVFKTISAAYDIALERAGATVDRDQRMLDVFGIVTEYHRLLEERLSLQRERRRKLAEARAKLAAEIEAKLAAEDKAWAERNAGRSIDRSDT